MRVPHTYTNTLHTCTSKYTRVWSHRICACADPVFSLFFVCLFHRGAHMLRSLTSFFFSNGKLLASACINRPVRGPRMMRKSCGYPGREIVWNTCWLVCGYGFVEVWGCFHGPSCIVLKMFRFSCVYPGEGAGVSGSP